MKLIKNTHFDFAHLHAILEIVKKKSYIFQMILEKVVERVVRKSTMIIYDQQGWPTKRESIIYEGGLVMNESILIT